MSLQFAAFSAQFLIFAGVAYLVLTGLFYAFAPANWVLKARGIEPARIIVPAPAPAPVFVEVPVYVPAPTRPHRDARGRFCKAPALA